MAVYIRHECADCGAQVVNHEKSKRYVHAGMAPEREPHRPIVRVVKQMEAAA